MSATPKRHPDAAASKKKHSSTAPKQAVEPHTPSGDFTKWRRGRRIRFWLYVAAHVVALTILLIGKAWQHSQEPTWVKYADLPATTVVPPTPTEKDVQDRAGILSDATKSTIAAYNQAFAKLPNEPALLVVTVDRVPAGQTIEAYTLETAETIGVGQAGRDNGIVYLIAVKDRKARMEVGYGLEATVPDAAADGITDDTVKDEYRNGNYNAGVTQVLANLGRTLNGNRELTVANAPAVAFDDHTEPGWWVYPITLMILSLLVWVPVKVIAALVWQVRYWRMHRAYENALRKIAPELPQRLGDRSDPAVAAARSKLKARYATSRKFRFPPDWYDCAFAFGTITWWQFMHGSAALATTSIVRWHRSDWYDPTFWSDSAGDTGNSWGGSSGGSSGSGGGGGFGGGGATSSW